MKHYPQFYVPEDSAPHGTVARRHAPPSGHPEWGCVCGEWWSGTADFAKARTLFVDHAPGWRGDEESTPPVMRVTRYLILTADSATDLADEVNEKLGDGWSVTGGVAIDSYPYVDPPTFARSQPVTLTAWTFAQAMVREEEL